MCMCDKWEAYLCYTCEQYLVGEVKELLHRYKYEIARDGDWWHGLPEYSVNIFCHEDDSDKPNPTFHINIYKVGDNGMDDYSMQWDLPSITKRELLKS